MGKKIILILMVLTMILPSSAWADESSFILEEHPLGSRGMYISLPEGWYFNTPRQIDDDFLKVSDNSRRKLSQYMADNDIDYNLVSKDLLEEINIILINSSQTKMMYNFSLLDETALTERAQKMIDMGVQENKDMKTAYHSYRLEKFNGCIFMIFEGTLETSEEKADFYQYTTMVNGYGVTCTYRAYEGADYETGKLILDEIVHTFAVDEIKEADPKVNMMKQMIAPAAVVVCFVGFTIFLFVRQLRKNKKEEAAKKQAETRE